jgi:hypothetical protein
MNVALDTAFGRVTVDAVDDATAQALVPELARAAAAGERTAGEVALGERRAWLKGSALRGRARWCHAVRKRIFGLALPREHERRALEWLRARLFQALRPLAAGALARGGWPTYQFLATEFVPGATPLDRALANADAATRARWIAELAREVARMHALHFVHRDLFLRNVLVAAPGPRELWFSDCWRGGDPWPGRDEAWDLGCLMLEGASFLARAEQSAFFGRYFAELQVQGRAVDPARVLARTARVRARWLARVRREPGRWRHALPPAESWDPRALELAEPLRSAARSGARE